MLRFLPLRVRWALLRWSRKLSEDMDRIEQAVAAGCPCYRCVDERDKASSVWPPTAMGFMIVCPLCGNKRCPHGTDHRNCCTGSNEPNQPGSRYQYGRES